MIDLKKISIVVVLLLLLIFLSYNMAAIAYKSKINQLRHEAAIYKRQAENFAQVIRGIREAADKATALERAESVLEKAPQ